jgi:hypothetical protein
MVAPAFVSDEDLIAHPVLVVARWNNAPVVPNHRIDEERVALLEYEVRTSITVERVIAGEAQPGDHTVLLGYAIGWCANGWSAYLGSTMMEGDVRDVREPNLWFLGWKRSWGPQDQQPFLALQTYRGIQPLALATYFRALRSAAPREAVPNFLGDPSPDVVFRALEYVAGRYFPETYVDGEYTCGGGLWTPRTPSDFEIDWEHYGLPSPRGHRIRPPLTFPWARSSGPPLAEQAVAVRGLLKHPDPNIRCRAADVYGDLAGAEGVPLFRELLEDADEYLRAIAIGWLRAHRDEPSTAALCEVANAITDPHLARAVRYLLSAWKSSNG